MLTQAHPGMATAELDQLVKDKETGQLAPYYLDLLGEGARLQVRACAWLPEMCYLLGLSACCALPGRLRSVAAHPSRSLLSKDLQGSSAGHAVLLEADRLVRQKMVALLPIQAMVDRLKSISSTMTIVTTRHGNLHMQARLPAHLCLAALLQQVQLCLPSQPLQCCADAQFAAALLPCARRCRESRCSWPLRCAAWPCCRLPSPTRPLPSRAL